MQIINQNITDAIVDNYMPYSTYVIMQRALPEIDGFKPSQRRILYTMFKMGLLKGVRKKSQGVVGQTMFYHPHGDMSIYETLVRMTKDAESFLLPYVDSKGNFGKHYSRDMQYASARYTEVRLMPIAKELFKEIEKNTEMINNYDGTLKEPRLLPVTFPNILVNSQSGTAVSMASNIASFNINEVIDLTVAFIKNPKVNVADYIKAPDFPTGGNIIYNEAVFNNIFNNGRGTFDIRATYRFEDNSIIYEEIPYSTTIEAIMDKVTQLVKDGKIKDIVDINDISGINSKGIEVVVKKNTNKEALVEKLFKTTPLQSSFGCNFNIIVNGRPKVLGIKDIIREWLAFRVKTIRKGAEYDRRAKTHKVHMLSAFKKVLLDINKAIKIIRETKKNNEVVQNLINTFDIDKEQAEFVAEIKLKHLNEEYLLNRIDEIKSLTDEIVDLDDLTTNKVTIAKRIISELQDVKKNYGQKRKSNIIDLNDIPKVEVDEVEVDNYNLKIYITKEGYVKKIPLTSLRGNYEIKVKDGDKIVSEIDTTNNSEILVFTDKKNVYKIKTYDMQDHKPSLFGEYMSSYLSLKNENILYITATNDFSGDILIGFDDGKVAKVALSVYETKQNRSMLKNAYADKNALFFKHIHEDMDLIAISSIDKVLLFNTSMINSKTSKTTIGVQIQKSKNDSTTVQYVLPDEFETNELEYYRVKSAGVGKYRK